MKTHYMKKLTIAVLLVTGSSLTAQTYYGAISPEASTGQLDIIESSTGATVSSTSITVAGSSINGITGMAHDASSNTTYVLVKQSSTISLGVIDLSSGDLSNLISLSEKMAGLAITPAGIAYGVTGDGADTPETIYEIDLNNGDISLNTQPGTGDDGEALAYNTNDGLLYRYGGGLVFQSIDPSNSTVTDIFLSHGVDNYAHALYYNPGTNNFSFAAGDSLYELATNGVLTGIAEFMDTNDGFKGLLSTSITGITDVIDEIELTIFPNPTSDRVTLSGLGQEKWDHEVIDLLGRVVLNRSSFGDRTIIDVSGLSKGRYTINSLNEKEKAITPLVIE